MRIVDCCVHPIQIGEESHLFSVGLKSFSDAYSRLVNDMALCGIGKSLLNIFTMDFGDKLPDVNNEKIAFCSLAHLTQQRDAEWLELLVGHGLKAIMFHPYLQGLTREKWPAAVSYAREAQRLGLFVCVCTAYGGKDIYEVEVLPFAKVIAAAVDCPVVFTHAGGRHVLDAMLVADAHPNVLLETSFSLHYWLGASVEKDFAFAMRKLGVDRWLYGSDAPFVPMTTSLKTHFWFFEKHNFRGVDIEMIMGKNAHDRLGI